MAISFLKDIEGKPIQPQSSDEWVWGADPSGQYSIKSAYHMMRGNTSEGTMHATYVELWKLKVPSKITAFAWRLLRDRLPTKRNLQTC